MPTATFRFGDDNQYEMIIVAGYLGRERYYVDGRLVLDHWSYHPNAVREFEVGKHLVRIVVTSGPTSFSSRAYVDDRLHVKELFPGFAAFIAFLFGWTHWPLWTRPVNLRGLFRRRPGGKADGSPGDGPASAAGRARLLDAGHSISNYSIYKTYGDVVAIFLVNVVLAWGADRRWTFHPEGSTRHDSLHQEVHRNHHADTLTQEEFAQLGIPLPDVEQYRGAPTARWEDNISLSAAAFEVPAALRARLESGPSSAWLVLLEDHYETMFGDGEYLYPRAAFWDKVDAEHYIEDTRLAETDAAKRQWYGYTVREVPLRLDRARSAITIAQGPGPNEHFDIADVVRLLAG